jgi:RNA polymerase sigma-70 factor (ECF subfamily)
LAEPIAHAPDMNDHMNRKEEIHQLYKAIDTLMGIDKAIILLHLEDQDYDEIAAITGLTRTNVSVRLVRIRRALKEYVERNQ